MTTQTTTIPLEQHRARLLEGVPLTERRLNAAGGHVLGGAIAARFAARHPDRLHCLVLVDSVGLGRFRPSIRFALGFARFLARPNERSFERFMDQCAYDLDRLQRDMGDDWQPFADYNIGLARAENAKDGGKLFRSVGLPRIPTDDLARISVPPDGMAGGWR